MLSSEKGDATRLEIDAEARQLFESARERNPLEYVFTLLRVEGITNERDPLRTLDDLSAAALLDGDAYCTILNPAESLLSLMENLCRIGRGESFDPFPFRDVLPAPNERQSHKRSKEFTLILDSAVKRLEDASKGELTTALRSAFPRHLLEACGNNRSVTVHHETRDALVRLVTQFLTVYRESLKEFLNQPLLYRLQRFEVLELLTDDHGLNGFRLHFSNGTSALFKRTLDGTEVVNVIPGSPLQFMGGIVGDMTEEWRIGNKLLHEIGLPGRYNELGTWQPLVFPGDATPKLQLVTSHSDDPDVQGGLLYMYCTGHRVYEFVALMDAELPSTIMTAGERFHLYKCDPSAPTGETPGRFIYDGWVDLPASSPDAVIRAIQDVTRLMNRTALAIDGPVTWRPKYTLRARGRSVWPGEQIAELNSIFGAYPSGADGEAIDAAVDWYNRGAGSENPFTSFLCFYIGIESLTHAVFDGSASFDLDLPSDRLVEKGQRREEIRSLYAEMYDEDPEGFVRKAYFDVVVGVTERTRRLIESVFGGDSEEFDLLFGMRPDTSLTEMRSRLAHGIASDLAPSEARAIRERVGEVRGICRDLILRLLLRIPPGDPVPGLQRVMSMSFRDPRSVDIATSLMGLPKQDWTIRQEWVAWD